MSSQAMYALVAKQEGYSNKIKLGKPYQPLKLKSGFTKMEKKGMQCAWYSIRTFTLVAPG